MHTSGATQKARVGVQVHAEQTGRLRPEVERSGGRRFICPEEHGVSARGRISTRCQKSGGSISGAPQLLLAPRQPSAG